MIITGHACLDSGKIYRMILKLAQEKAKKEKERGGRVYVPGAADLHDLCMHVARLGFCH